MKEMLIMLAAALLLFCAGRASAEDRVIQAQTAVERWGQMPQSFEITGQALPEGVSAEDFSITGEAAGWESEARHPFSAEVLSVSSLPDGSGWTLVPERFPEKYFYVREMEVTCAAHPELSFSLGDISETVTAVADEFTAVEDPESRLTARVFTPTAEGPFPLVIVFHGYGDNSGMLSYRTAVAWAEPNNQEVRPCTVIAPQIMSAFYTSEIARARIYEGLMRYVSRLTEEGRVDAGRIYVMGNSFGGMAALELAEQYPDRIAAVLSLCPAAMYFPRATANLPLLKDIPVSIAQAENDETIPSEAGRTVARSLTEAGNPDVRLRIYTDEEMNAAGAVFGREQTYSFHHVELAVMEDPSYAEWLFAQRK